MSKSTVPTATPAKVSFSEPYPLTRSPRLTQEEISAVEAKIIQRESEAAAAELARIRAEIDKREAAAELAAEKDKLRKEIKALKLAAKKAEVEREIEALRIRANSKSSKAAPVPIKSSRSAPAATPSRAAFGFNVDGGRSSTPEELKLKADIDEAMRKYSALCAKEAAFAAKHNAFGSDVNRDRPPTPEELELKFEKEKALKKYLILSAEKATADHNAELPKLAKKRKSPARIQTGEEGKTEVSVSEFQITPGNKLKKYTLPPRKPDYAKLEEARLKRESRK